MTIAEASADEIAAATLRVFRRTVPAAVPSINFLSGGLSPLIFLRSRMTTAGVASQAWQGNPNNVDAAQQALLKRARLNGTARRGEYLAAYESMNESRTRA